MEQFEQRSLAPYRRSVTLMGISLLIIVGCDTEAPLPSGRYGTTVDCETTIFDSFGEIIDQMSDSRLSIIEIGPEGIPTVVGTSIFEGFELMTSQTTERYTSIEQLPDGLIIEREFEAGSLTGVRVETLRAEAEGIRSEEVSNGTSSLSGESIEVICKGLFLPCDTFCF